MSADTGTNTSRHFFDTNGKVKNPIHNSLADICQDSRIQYDNIVLIYIGLDPNFMCNVSSMQLRIQLRLMHWGVTAC